MFLVLLVQINHQERWFYIYHKLQIFSLDFLPTNQSDYEIKAKVKVCMKDNEYKLYDTSLGGYEMVDDYIIVMSSDKTKITK